MKEITNADGSRNWEANILLDNIKRLELENAELKGKLDAYKMSENEANEIIAELKAENEQLKKYIERMKEPELKVIDANIALDNKELKAENEKLIEGLGVANKYVNKYHQTLQEIKKIAERQLLVTNIRTYQMVYYADFSEYRNEILQKITKAGEE